MYSIFIKRILDFILSIIGIILLSPITLIVIICLAILNRGSIFFFQDRPKKRGEIFKVIKFKTMNDKKDIHGELLSDAERLTSFGKFVRKTSLDEIPQLINVLKGDMSLVGPRPLLPEYLPLFSEEQKKRHNVKPGITGWAQVNGRNAISYTKKFELDVWYVENISFMLDVKILFMTVKKVIKSEDISASNHATIEKFNGKN